MGDRFIPLRQSDDFLTSNYILKYEDQVHCKPAYKDILLKTIHVNTNSQILKMSKYDRKPSANLPNQYTWPVKPRKEHVLYDVEPIRRYQHFLTSYDERRHPIDWSETGNLVVCGLSKDRVQQITLPGKQWKVINCVLPTNYIKWNQYGDILGALYVHAEHKAHFYHFSLQKNLDPIECACKVSYQACTYQECRIMTIDWRRDDILLTGCSNGTLSIFEGFKLQTYYVSNGPILNIKISSNQNYFIMVKKDSAYVFHWPPRLNVAWHPWQESLLALANNGVVRIFNVAMVICIDRVIVVPDYNITSLTWNELSGELVIGKTSLCGEDSIITVYSNAQTVVREIDYHVSNVQHLFWSPDRSILGSVDDSQIYLWNFFGNNSKRKKDVKQKNPLSIHSSNFGKCIR